MIATVVGFALMITTVCAQARDASPARFGGIYKVVSSNDPLFPVSATREYFLDFGRGITFGKFSGSVAVSVRENPDVKVRIMSWEYFPNKGMLLIGNPFAQGSRSTMIRGAWQLSGIDNNIMFERGEYQMVLQRADPADY